MDYYNGFKRLVKRSNINERLWEYFEQGDLVFGCQYGNKSYA